MRRSDRLDAISATRSAMRTLARRPQSLDAEVAELDVKLTQLTKLAAPRLLREPGIGKEIAARLLLTAGEKPHPHPQRLRARRALRRVTDRGIQREDHPPPPQPRRRPPS